MFLYRLLVFCAVFSPLILGSLQGAAYNTYSRLVNVLACAANGGTGCGWTIAVIRPLEPPAAGPPTKEPSLGYVYTKLVRDDYLCGYRTSEYGPPDTLLTYGRLYPNINERTKKVYTWLKNFSGSKKLLSGAFGGFIGADGEDGFSLQEAEDIFAATSKQPAVYGLDCGRGWETSRPGREADLIECWSPEAADYALGGGLLTVSLHLPNPVYEGNDAGSRPALKETLTDEEYGKILECGTPERERWLDILDKVATGLNHYRERNITVLYRPLHGMNGDCYWWGGSRPLRTDLFRRLWVDMYNFLSRRGLDNLLWVYSPDDRRSHRADYYPGDEYVDVVGLSSYLDNPRHMIGYREMLAFNKPFALTEVGPQTTNGRYDYGKLVEAIKNHYPKTTYFMAWKGAHSPLKNEGAWEAFNNPYVVNKGDFRISDSYY